MSSTELGPGSAGGTQDEKGLHPIRTPSARPAGYRPTNEGGFLGVPCPGDSITDDDGDNIANDNGDSIADDAGNSFTNDSGDSITDDNGDSITEDDGDSITDDDGDSITDEESIRIVRKEDTAKWIGDVPA